MVIYGCATNEGGYTKSADVEARLIGMSAGDVVQVFGAPENEVVISDRKAWTYSDEIKHLAGGTCRISLTIKDEKVVSAIVNADCLTSAPMEQLSLIA